MTIIYLVVFFAGMIIGGSFGFLTVCIFLSNKKGNGMERWPVICECKKCLRIYEKRMVGQTLCSACAEGKKTAEETAGQAKIF